MPAHEPAPVVAAAAVAAHGLAPSTLERPDRPLDEGAWRGLVALARRERILGHLARVVADAALPVTDGQLEEVADLHAAAMAAAVQLDAQARRTSAALTAAGLDHRLLKGASFAHLDYPDPSERQYGDVDLLVRSADLERAVACLVADGHQRAHAELRPGFERRFAKTVELRAAFEVDLHRTLTLEPFGWWIHEADLFARPAALALGGAELLAPPREVRFLHACYHAVLGNRPIRLVPLRDLAQMALVEDFDWHDALALARRWRGEAVVAHALREAAERFSLAEPGEPWRWAAQHRAEGFEARALAAYLHGRRRQAERAAVAVRALPGWRARARYLFAVALPSRRYLAGRHTRRLAWLRRPLSR